LGRRAALPAWEDLPRGCILGSVEVHDCREDIDLPDDLCFHDPFVAGPRCWVLQDPRPLPTPFPCKGALA
jgi:hypothetical protein